MKRDALTQKIIQEIENDDQIIVTGYVDYKEIEYYYSIMDVSYCPLIEKDSQLPY